MINSLRIHEIFQKIAGFHWIFENDFLKFPNPLHLHMSIFSYIIGTIFTKRSIKLFKKYEKMAKIPQTIQKLKVSIDFSTQISVNSLAPGGSASRTP